MRCLARWKAYALKALENGDAVWFGADSGRQMDRKLLDQEPVVLPSWDPLAALMR